MNIGVTTWSLPIPEQNLEEILRIIREDLGIDTIQVGAWGLIQLSPHERARRVELIDASGLNVFSTTAAFAGEDYSSHATAIATVGFFDPDRVEERMQHLLNLAEMSKALDVHLLTTHIGHIPSNSSDPAYGHMLEVTRRVCDELGQRDIVLAAEIGGLESSATLIDFIGAVDRQNLKVNFDPANVLRASGADPLRELEVIKSLVVGVHLKDAMPLLASGVWGEEKALGQGAVDLKGFIASLKAMAFEGPLIIERESGDDMIGDIRRGAELLRQLCET